MTSKVNYGYFSCVGGIAGNGLAMSSSGLTSDNFSEL